MALLPFLARGYTDKQGPYKRQLGKALIFLARLSSQNQGNLIKAGGSMSSQAYATLALSEFSELTRDGQLWLPIQLALSFMIQPNKDGSGWSAMAGDPSDTLTTAGVITALNGLPSHREWNWSKSACFKRAGVFLDSVQRDNGAQYGLFTPNDGPPDGVATSAGLACRLAMGWKLDIPHLQRGASGLVRLGPTDDILHDYHSTMILFTFGRDMWVQWNVRMKKRLLQSQSRDGHSDGSWLEGFDKSKEAQQMGRLYVTALATLILEVYYRYPTPN